MFIRSDLKIMKIDHLNMEVSIRTITVYFINPVGFGC